MESEVGFNKSAPQWLIALSHRKFGNPREIVAPNQNRPTIRNVEKNYMEYSFFRLDT